MIKSKLWSVAVAAWVLLPYGTLAQDPQRMKNALNNVQQEMMACAAYFNIFAVCIAKGGDDQKTVDGLRELSSKFIDRCGDVGKSIGMTEDAMSRYKVAQDDQFNLINKDCVNLSSLISRHQKRCLLIMDAFKAAVNEYMK